MATKSENRGNVGQVISSPINRIIKQLKSGKINIDDVPKEFALDVDILKVEREMGIRRSCQRGFDVIRQEYFVEEEIIRKNLLGEEEITTEKITFGSFKEYYDFLNGDIYTNSCYYQCDFEDIFLNEVDININELKKNQCFISETIDDYGLNLSQEEIDKYNYGEKIKDACKKWVEKFNACNTYEDLLKIRNNYKKSKISNIVDARFFLWQYIFYDIHDNNRFHIIMKYMSAEKYIGDDITKELCFIYNPNKVLNAYNYSSGSQQKIYRRKKKIADTVKAIENDNIELEVRGFFDVKTHYFYEETRVYRYEHYRGRIRRKYYADILHYFETFDQFIEYRKGNLKNCDISGAITLDIDFSKFDVDKETTKLPICLQMDLKYIVKKIYYKDFFWVGQFWNNKEGYVVKKYTHKFEYFFDFVSFLKGDLSYVDLITCDGLNNLNDISGINFLNAKLVSSFCEKFDIPFTKYNINNNLIESFKIVQNNEEQTALYLNEYRDEDIDDLFCDTEDVQRVQYISDLHLMHKIKNANCKSMEDITCLIQHIINNIIDESGNLVLIGGDVASEFSLFELFIKILRKELDSYRIRKVIVFVLDNHEFWGFSNHSIDQIVAKYRCLLEENNMYLLHNDLNCTPDSGQ